MNNVDSDLIFLNDKWHKLYNNRPHVYMYGTNYALKTFLGFINLNKNVNNYAVKILNKITYVLCNESHPLLPYDYVSYPTIFIEHHPLNISVQLTSNTSDYIYFDKSSSYQNALKTINELIWAISVHEKNYLGSFMVDWNYIISAEQKNMPISLIINHLNKSKKMRHLLTKPINKFTMNYRKLDMLLIHDAKYIFSKLNDNDKLVLIPIIHFNWNKFTIDSILNNASVIANGCTCYDINVVRCLRKCHLINGRDLQKKLVLAMKNNNDKNYSVRKVMSSIYKIKNKNAIYHYNSHDILHNPIHKVSAHALKRIITIDIDRSTTKEKLNKLIQKRNEVTNQMKILEHK